MRRLPPLALLAILAAPPALAEEPTSLHFDLQSFHAVATSGGLFTLEGTEIGAHLRPHGGLQLGYANQPLIYETTGGAVEAVRNRLAAELSAGIGLLNRVELALSLPAVLYQEGQSVLGSAAPLRAGVGDLRLLPKVRLLGNGISGLSLAALAALRFPTAGEQALAGGGVAFEPHLLVAFRVRSLALHGVLGYRTQPERQLYSLKVDDQLLLGIGARHAVRRFSALAELTAATDVNQPFGRRQTTPVTATLGARFAFKGGWTVSAGAGPGLVPGFGAPRFHALLAVAYAPFGIDTDRDGIPDEEDQCPLEPEDRDGFQDRDGCPDPDNDGDGIPDVRDRCPNEPEDRDGFEDEDGCPDPDNDGDGIPDVRDRCPNDPEDRDGFEDGDGCPDPDNDGDGIPDHDDACPNEPETRNGFADADGCPEADRDGDGIPDVNDRCPDQKGTVEEGGCPPAPPPRAGRSARRLRKGVRAELRGREILTEEAIYFDHGKWTIKARFVPLLQAVADLIARNRRIHVVYVEGHADGSGEDAHNQWLSFYRAEEVLLRLRKLGAPRFKVRAFGRGADQPASPEETAEGRAANRRVVFHVEWKSRRARPAALARADEATSRPVRVKPAALARTDEATSRPTSAKPAPLARRGATSRPASAKPAMARPVGPEEQALRRLGPILRKLDRAGGKTRPGAE